LHLSRSRYRAKRYSTVEYKIGKASHMLTYLLITNMNRTEIVINERDIKRFQENTAEDDIWRCLNLTDNRRNNNRESQRT